MATTASGGNVLHQIQIQIIGNLSLLVQNLQNAQAQTTKTTATMQTNFQRVTESVSKLADKLRVVPQYLSSIAGVGATVFGAVAIKNFIEDIITLAAKVEVLEVVSAQVGKVAGYTSTEINNLVQSIKQMNITTQQANMTVALMIQANLDLSKATQLARVAQDAAVLANVASQEALRGLVHGIVTLQPEVLRTYKIITNLELAYRRYAASIGISFDELDQQTKQSIALNEVLKVGARIHGTYLAAMTKAGKQLLSLQRVTEEFRLSMGREFQEGFARVITSLTNFFNTAKESEKLHAAMKIIANVLDNFLQLLMKIANFAVANPNLIIQLFNIAAITLITRAIGGLAGSVAMLIKTLSTGALIDKVGTITFLASALGYALSKLPWYISAITAALAPLLAVMITFRVGMLEAARAVLAFNGTLALAATTLPGMLGIIGAIAGAVGLLIMALGNVGRNSKQAQDDLAALRLEANASAAEFRDLRAQALELAKQYIVMYEETEESDQKTKDLKETLDDLKKLLPALLGDVDDVTEGYNRMKGAVKDLVKENARLMIPELWRQNRDIIAKGIPEAVDKSKTALLAYRDWVRDNLYKEIWKGREQGSVLVPTEAFDLFGDKVQEVIKNVEDLRKRSALGEDIADELAVQRKAWDELNEEIGRYTALNIGTEISGTVAKFADMGEAVLYSTEALAGQNTQVRKNLEQVEFLKLQMESGLEVPTVIQIPTLQREDERKINDLVARIQTKINEWATKGVEPSLESVKESVRADVKNALIELGTMQESLEAVMRKPGYAKYAKYMDEFQRVQGLLLTLRQTFIDAGMRMEEEAVSKFLVQQNSLNEEVLKNRVEAGEVGIDELKKFYITQLEIMESMGAELTAEQKKQQSQFKANLVGIDLTELDKKERFYKSMLKYDESYYAKLKEVMGRKLPFVEAKYGKLSQEYVNAVDDIRTIDEQQIMHHADRYKRMSALDGKYFEDYIWALNDSMLEAYETYGKDSEQFKELQAQKKSAEEDFLSWRKAEWAKQSFYMQGILDFMENSFSAMISAFSDMEINGKKRAQQIWESMRNIFFQIVGQMIQKWLMFQMLKGLFPGTFGGVSFGTYLAGKQAGGYTGDKPEDEITGFYHGKEYVLNAPATKKYRPLLELMNQGLDIRKYLSSVLPGAGGTQASLLINLNRTISKLSDNLSEGLLPIQVVMQPAAVVSDRGIHLASISGEHKKKRVGI